MVDESLGSPVSTIPKPFVFVLMPFEPTFNDIYKFGIKGAADTQLIRVPVYGYVSGYGGSATWQSNQWIPVQRTRDVSIVGLSLAVLRVARADYGVPQHRERVVFVGLKA